MNGRNVRTGVCIFAENMPGMVRFYRDVLGFDTDWDGGSFAEFFTAGGRLSFFMYSKEDFVKAINEDFKPSKGINQTFEIGMWLPAYKDVDEEYERLCGLESEISMCLTPKETFWKSEATIPAEKRVFFSFHRTGPIRALLSHSVQLPFPGNRMA